MKAHANDKILHFLCPALKFYLSRSSQFPYTPSLSASFSLPRAQMEKLISARGPLASSSSSFLRLSYSESRTCLSAPHCCSGGGSRVGGGEEHKQNYLASGPSSPSFLYFLEPRCHPPPQSRPRPPGIKLTHERKRPSRRLKARSFYLVFSVGKVFVQMLPLPRATNIEKETGWPDAFTFISLFFSKPQNGGGAERTSLFLEIDEDKLVMSSGEKMELNVDRFNFPGSLTHCQRFLQPSFISFRCPLLAFPLPLPKNKGRKERRWPKGGNRAPCEAEGKTNGNRFYPPPS